MAKHQNKGSKKVRAQSADKKGSKKVRAQSADSVSGQEQTEPESLVPNTPEERVYSWESQVTRVPTEQMYSWESQLAQYSRTGPPGISYFSGRVTDEIFVDCLLYRDEAGEIVGILNHYPTDLPPHERQGGRNIWVHPGRRRQGIGTALLLEALIRFGPVPEGDPKFTDAGLGFMKGLEGRFGDTELDWRVEGWEVWLERRKKEREEGTDPLDPRYPSSNP
jgi:GNAT superfamily N-acetyltransferase